MPALDKPLAELSDAELTAYLHKYLPGRPVSVAELSRRACVSSDVIVRLFEANPTLRTEWRILSQVRTRRKRRQKFNQATSPSS